VGSETGSDLKLSSKAKRRFPCAVECKNHEKFLTIYNHYEQAKGHTEKEKGGLIPIVVIKMNRREPLVILDLDHLLSFMATFNET